MRCESGLGITCGYRSDSNLFGATLPPSCGAPRQSSVRIRQVKCLDGTLASRTAESPKRFYPHSQEPRWGIAPSPSGSETWQWEPIQMGAMLQDLLRFFLKNPKGVLLRYGGLG
jgi:hypothetical protein